ncbi:MAG: YraN family protein [Spirochaetes bacterium]|nr:YraN family protein [Spirochaetota bacterium]
MSPDRPTRRDRGLSGTAKGRLGEDAACAFLEARGWSVVARNWRTRTGELDAVAVRAGELAFVEVKSVDAYGPESAERTVGRTKRARIVETAQYFLARNRQYDGMSMRFDVVLVREGSECVHIERAFMERT